jgi:nucleoside-diphosphate-sugar epimerase
VTDELVEAGRSRAASVGWPDAYAYTKALGEQALQETKGDVPVSIVRPSIIESSLAEPFPGWIRGFRMAEPVIISYARGLLKEFPGVPEGTST